MTFYHLSLIFLSVISAVATSDDLSVIIVGAGPSGIAAATRLLKNNITNIRILEAENRIGGRVFSKKFDKNYVDIGAEWCHGEKDNIVYSMVKSFGILKHTEFPSKIYYSDGLIVDETFVEELKDFLEEFHDNSGTEGDTGHNFLTLYNVSFLDKYKNDLEKLKLAIAAIDFSETYVTSLESSPTWFQVSHKTFFKSSEGDQNLNWNGLGYKTMLEILMEKYPNPNHSLPIDDKFNLSQEVTKISMENSSKITVQCTDNSSLVADHVIFTPSLGVLKAKHSTIFEPNLSPAKQDAIRKLGFGVVMKVYLHFPQIWWKEDDYGFDFMWSLDEKYKLAMEFREGPVKDGVSWLYYFNHIYFAENNPNVLMAWFSGPLIPETEKLTDQIITDGCMYTINKFLSKTYNITNPDKILRSFWHSNPHFLGTYTYEPLDAVEENLHEKLAAPVLSEEGVPNICFAGETTSSHHFGTVHGAIEAGLEKLIE